MDLNLQPSSYKLRTWWNIPLHLNPPAELASELSHPLELSVSSPISEPEFKKRIRYQAWTWIAQMEIHSRPSIKEKKVKDWSDLTGIKWLWKRIVLCIAYIWKIAIFCVGCFTIVIIFLIFITVCMSYENLMSKFEYNFISWRSN